MPSGSVYRRRTFPLSVLLALAVALPCAGQTQGEGSQQKTPAVDTLGLSQPATDQLRAAMAAHDYVSAEKILLAEINRVPHSAGAARLLSYAGSVYYLDHDFLNAAVAWKRAEALAPLEPSLRFSLAMAYIEMGRSEWARSELESLASADARNALYPYWLGRLDYDGHEYNHAIAHFKQAIALDPKMARAYDNLGLCYYYQNDNALAVQNYERAIALERDAAHPSPWPYLNLGIVQQFLNQQKEAEANLRAAIRIDPDLAQAHFQLGTVLEDTERRADAVVELKEAARLKPAYPEPHMALARLYHKLGQESAAREEAAIYQRLRTPSTR